MGSPPSPLIGNYVKGPWGFLVMAIGSYEETYNTRSRYGKASHAAREAGGPPDTYVPIEVIRRRLSSLGSRVFENGHWVWIPRNNNHACMGYD